MNSWDLLVPHIPSARKEASISGHGLPPALLGGDGSWPALLTRSLLTRALTFGESKPLAAALEAA